MPKLDWRFPKSCVLFIIGKWQHFTCNWLLWFKGKNLDNYAKWLLRFFSLFHWQTILESKRFMATEIHVYYFYVWMAIIGTITRPFVESKCPHLLVFSFLFFVVVFSCFYSSRWCLNFCWRAWWASWMFKSLKMPEIGWSALIGIIFVPLLSLSSQRS